MAKVSFVVVFLLSLAGRSSATLLVSQLFQFNTSSWSTTLPNGAIAEESGKMFGNLELVYFISKSSNLTGAGFNPAVTLYDFNTNNVAIRFHLASGSVACFITSTTATYNQVNAELGRRQTAREVETGTPVIVTAEANDRLAFQTLLGKSLSLTKHCLLAVVRNNVYQLTTSSPAPVNPSPLTASGLIVPTQMELSTPYQIFLENTITLN